MPVPTLLPTMTSLLAWLFEALDSPTVVVILAALAAVVAVAGIAAAITSYQRRLVAESSIALWGLERLNAQYRTLAAVREPLAAHFPIDVDKKSKHDRFDLTAWMSQNVLEHEQWFAGEIAARLSASAHFDEYSRSVQSLSTERLGMSSHARLTDARFAALELRAFARGQLPEPAPRAKVTAAVSYTSPKGQNSYSRTLEWGFAELREGLTAAQDQRSRQSTVQFQRRKERTLMTSRLRVQILRRDGSRCKLCGASASDGITLHIDHIHPVSRGGRTVPDNLQTLCESCNLGKGVDLHA